MLLTANDKRLPQYKYSLGTLKCCNVYVRGKLIRMFFINIQCRVIALGNIGGWSCKEFAPNVQRVDAMRPQQSVIDILPQLGGIGVAAGSITINSIGLV
ncbi:hypothetical protein DPMN_083663 [Dreissena polymorpha]|uniref:Uncharacterized protein n=1 Tax=Dreissena polymorpha TaxID=45954 RepID=A0A9D3Y9B7_DREPO|nr:hypothetical protein DPMN_083663 [Dreissena polymorpha]